MLSIVNELKSNNINDIPLATIKKTSSKLQLYAFFRFLDIQLENDKKKKTDEKNQTPFLISGYNIGNLDDNPKESINKIIRMINR